MIKKKAFTIVELLVAIVILTTLMLMLMPVFSYSKKTVDTMNRLDVYHDTRKISHEINSTLKLSTEVIFPEAGMPNTWRSCVIFRNPLNQVFIIYISDKSDLISINYDRIRNGKVATGKVLATGIREFAVRRVESNLLEYKVKLNATGGGELEFSGMVNLANLI
ncbi:MAG: type II secretion system protein [Candidatus Riflebacteria bacterium]